MKARFVVRIAGETNALARYESLALAEAHARDAVDGGHTIEVVRETVVSLFRPQGPLLA